MDQERTYKWIQDRLHDLYSGNLSDADRMQLEEIAKSDPFIRDALEGYQAHAHHDHSALLNVLSQRIQNKSKSKRTKLLPLSRGWVIQAVAASLVLILATWVVIYYVQKQNESVFVASESLMKDSLERNIEVQLSAPDTLNENPPTGNVAVAESTDESETRINNAKTIEKTESREQRAESHSNIVTNTKDDDNTISDHAISPLATTQALEENKENDVASPKVAEQMAAGSVANKSMAQRDEGYYANQINPDLMSKRVTGKVIDDATGEPLLFASIYISNTNLVSTTDIDGNFELYLPNALSSIEVNYTGYVDTLLTAVQGHENLVIKMKTGASIPPMVIKSLKEQQALSSNGDNYVAFHKSNIDFIKFINGNSLFPIQSSYTPTSKEVTVEFRISPSHQVSIKSVKSSADKKYSAEAIRLINEGPGWVCEDGVYPCMRKYTIYFK